MLRSFLVNERLKSYPGCATNFGEQGESLFVHDATETKVGNHDVSVFIGSSEEEILWLEILDRCDICELGHVWCEVDKTYRDGRCRSRGYTGLP